jgi:hypothetical protein
MSNDGPTTEDFDGFLSGGYDCDRCGAWFWRIPRIVECESCGDELCPNCRPVECACGSLFCPNCVVTLHDEDDEYVMCPSCLRAAGLCESCGEGEQEVRYLDPERHGEMLLCPVCALARAEEAIPSMPRAS